MAGNIEINTETINTNNVSTVKWIIPNFSSFNEQNITSPKFSLGNSEWILQFYSKNYNSRYSGIGLTCDTSETKIRAKCIFSILGRNGNNTNIVERLTRLYGPGNFESEKKFVRKDALSSFIYNDILTIICEISIYQEAGPSSSSSFNVVLWVDGKRFCAHKKILADSSSVFKAMFDKDENKSEWVINDIDKDVMEEVLRFIYEGKREKNKVNAFDLLDIADKYALKKLKSLCEEELSNNVSVGKVLGLLKSADSHNAIEFQTKAINFIKENAIEVMEEVIKTQPESLADMLINMTLKKDRPRKRVKL